VNKKGRNQTTANHRKRQIQNDIYSLESREKKTKGVIGTLLKNQIQRNDVTFTADWTLRKFYQKNCFPIG